ncbi:hypothetical protein JHK86_040212 [Glycine max]|nr:hypothetical protein JHK86_040212 [Glycine max]
MPQLPVASYGPTKLSKKAAILKAKGEGSVHLFKGSRLPKEYWEQMMPKKLPSPSSSPSKGTNSVSPSSSLTTKNDGLPMSDGKV